MTDQKILKAVLMLRRWGNKSKSKEEQIEEQKRWLEEDPAYADVFDDRIQSLREDLAKAPEQLEAEREREFEEFLEKETEWDLKEQQMHRGRERDEWDDLWADRARSVGAIGW